MSSASPAVPSSADVLASRLGTASIVTGVVSIVVGIIALVWPKATLLVLAILFAIQLVIFAILQLTALSAMPAQPRWLKVVAVILAVLTLAAGVVCLFRPNASLIIIAILLAAGWIASGISSLVSAFQSGIGGGMRTWLIISGLVLILGGLLVAVFPRESLYALTIWSGILLIVIGLALVATALIARRQYRKLAATM
jgi:uncharacterized membrane protein HdeD (DUF308 family)